MVVSRFEVPGKEPVSFLKNLQQRAKVLVLQLKTNEVAMNVPQRSRVTKRSFFPSATVKGLT